LRCGDESVAVPAYHLAWTLAPAAVLADVKGEGSLWMEVLA